MKYNSFQRIKGGSKSWEEGLLPRTKNSKFISAPVSGFTTSQVCKVYSGVHGNTVLFGGE